MTRTTGATPGTSPSCPARGLVLPVTALCLALAACTPSPGPDAGPTGTETTVQPSSPASEDPTPAALPTTDPAPGPTASAAASNARLTITMKQNAAAEPVQYVLECVDGAPGPASTLPNAEVACARLAQLGAGFFTARPDKDVLCTQQYGGEQTASITGDLDGTSVLASFALTDGCEISRWKKVQDILGAPGAQ